MASETGYRRPPTESQFKKGVSGNPRGRPKGSSNFKTLLERELAQKIVVTENGKKKSLTRLQAVVKRLVAGGLQGDQKQLLALVEVLRRMGSVGPGEPEALLPDNYEALLDAYVATQSTGRPGAQRKSSDSDDAQ